MLTGHGKGNGFVRADMRLDNLLVLLAMLGSIGVGIYEAGSLKATLADAVTRETAVRAGETRALNERIDGLQETLADVRGDVRELRSYMMTPLVKEGRK